MRIGSGTGAGAWVVGAVLGLLATGCGDQPEITVPDSSSTPADMAEALSPLLGTWAGNIVSQPVTCSNGQVVQSKTESSTITVQTAAGDQVYLPLTCGDVYFDANGNAAQQTRDVNCDPQLDPDGTVINRTLKNATLVATGSALDLNFTMRWVFSGTLTGTCTIPYSGKLVKK